MELRRRRRRPVQALEIGEGTSEDLAVPAALVDSDPGPQERAETAEPSRFTGELLADLSSRQRSIATLRWGRRHTS